MSVYSGFGLTLKSVIYDDLPILCQMRNRPDILRYMDCRKPVTIPVLEYWLRKTERSTSTYSFIAYHDNIPVGYLELTNCIYEKGLCNDGIFLFDAKPPKPGLGSLIYICREKLLSDLQISTVISYIRPENKRCIAFIEKIGAVYNGTENGFLKFIQDRNRRLKALHKIACSLGHRDEFEREFPYVVQNGLIINS